MGYTDEPKINPDEEEIPVSETVREISEAQFQVEVLDSAKPVVVDFWAPWCGPCRMVAPELEKLAGKVGDRVSFVKVNVDEARDVAIKYGIMSIPTIAKFEGGTLVTQVVGARGADALGREFGLV
jgi:thioredoxin 1